MTLFLSQHGYFKKITPQSLRMSGEQKFKEDDALSMSVESSNAAELMFFTDKAQVYKTRASDLPTARRASWVTTYPRSSAWTRARASWAWCCRATTAAI